VDLISSLKTLGATIVWVVGEELCQPNDGVITV